MGPADAGRQRLQALLKRAALGWAGLCEAAAGPFSAAVDTAGLVLCVPVATELSLCILIHCSFDALGVPTSLLPAYLCAMFLELDLAFFRCD